MKRSQTYKDYVELMEVVCEWNVNTRCYVLGRIDADYEAGILPENERRALIKKIAITEEEIEKINFDKKLNEELRALNSDANEFDDTKKKKRSKKYEDYIKLMNAVSEWNVNTGCYFLGRIGADFCEKRLPEDEWLELAEKIPLSAQEKYDINF